MNSDRRHREIGDDYLETLFNSVTLDQLKSALLELSESGSFRPKNREDAIRALRELGRDKEVCEHLLCLEATTPAKHCLLMQFGNSINLNSLELNAVLTDENSDLGVEFKVVGKYTDSADQLILLEHSVEVCDWKTVDEDETLKRKEEFSLRHPITLRIDESKKVIAFFYPGFSQGSGIKKSKRIGYEELLSNLIYSLEHELSFGFTTIPVERCIKHLRDAESRRLKVIETKFESSKGRMALAAPSSHNLSVDEYLSKFLSPYVTSGYEAKLSTAIREALKNTNPNSLAVLWSQEEIVSRLTFWEIGTEFLFVWYGSSRSIYHLKAIFEIIVSISRNLETPSLDQLINKISEMPSEEVFTPGSLSMQYNLEVEKLRTVLADLTRAQIIRPVYRLHTTQLIQQYKNEWTEDLVGLRRKFETESNEIIDGALPENIEVAFKVVREAE